MYQNIGNYQGQQWDSFPSSRGHFQKAVTLKRVEVKLGNILSYNNYSFLKLTEYHWYIHSKGSNLKTVKIHLSHDRMAVPVNNGYVENKTPAMQL